MRALVTGSTGFIGSHHQQTGLDERDVAQTEADFAYLQQLVETKPSIPIEQGLIDVFERAQRPELLGNLSRWIESGHDL